MNGEPNDWSEEGECFTEYFIDRPCKTLINFLNGQVLVVFI